MFEILQILKQILQIIKVEPKEVKNGSIPFLTFGFQVPFLKDFS